MANQSLVLRAHGLAKSFGATVALSSAQFDLRSGEVHALVGENGSGKSTFIKILAGVHHPDAGEIELGGEPMGQMRSPADSIRAGVATVFQEVLVVEARSVLENIWLGTDARFKARTSDTHKRAKAKEILDDLLGSSPSLDMPVEHLSLSDRQACGIARALVRDPRILILDEATSALDVATRDRLFALLRRRAEAGCAVIFISHRMDEIAEIGDRITVMRSGETVATRERGSASTDELVRLMTGADALTEHVAERKARVLGEVALEVGDFNIRAGELVGLAGLEGQGQDDFIKMLAATAGKSAAYVPRERRAESLFESKTILENFGLLTYEEDTTAGLIKGSSTRSRLEDYKAKLNIKLGRSDDLITTLSGGNQQKVVVARWLASSPQVLLLNDPTRGVDLGAKRDLYKLLLELAEEGLAVVMLSTELDEQIELMDRVLVFREGKVFTEFAREELSRHALVSAFFGEREKKTGRRKSNV
ncbi:MAG TPA: sugar ABC transporter ATP-binding protein [Vicinamibacterales bacterium]|nr:sugar ABC transporter ATP-binding protein [Vicinamibacterales bacterium]